MFPCIVLQNTRFPAVASTPDHGGVTTRCSQRISPVSGTIAISRPQLSSGRKRATPPIPPPPPSPGRNRPPPPPPAAREHLARPKLHRVRLEEPPPLLPYIH